MYVQIRKSSGAEYIYIVESYRKPNGDISHRTLKSLGKVSEFIKDDPNALEKLKLDIKQKSYQLRNQNVIESLRSIQKVSTRFVDSYDFESGYPKLNYANYMLRIIWRDILKLDYRINYLQKKSYSHIDINLGDILFYKIISSILHFERISEKEWGTETALIADNNLPERSEQIYYSLKQIYAHLVPSIYSFLQNKILIDTDLRSFIDIIQIGKSPNEPVDIDFNTTVGLIGYNKLDLKNSDDQIKACDNLAHTIALLMLSLIKKRLEYQEIFVSFMDISKALQRAEVLVEYSYYSQVFFYTKVNNGYFARLMNSIMKSFELKPLLNSQDRVELSKRLRAKFKSDLNIIPLQMHTTLTR